MTNTNKLRLASFAAVHSHFGKMISVAGCSRIWFPLIWDWIYWE